MSTFKKYKPKIEKELHGIIESELDALEEGLELLKHEFSTGKGILDLLCVDSGKKLVIIEVKLFEDENVLFQALRYYSEIDKDRYVIAQVFSDEGIDPEQRPRIILIAERFSDDIRRLSTLVVPDVELYEYTVLVGSSGEKGIVYHPVSLPKIDDTLSRPKTIEDHINYITVEALRTRLEECREKVKVVGDGIEEYVTQSYIGFKFQGRQLAWIVPHRTSFDLGAIIIDEKRQLLRYEPSRVEMGDEDCSDIMEEIIKSYQNLGGKQVKKSNQSIQ